MIDLCPEPETMRNTFRRKRKQHQTSILLQSPISRLDKPSKGSLRLWCMDMRHAKVQKSCQGTLLSKVAYVQVRNTRVEYQDRQAQCEIVLVLSATDKAFDRRKSY